MAGMTYLEVLFNYGATPGENELRAIDSMREVYGIQRVQIVPKQHTVRVQYDASRLNQDAVAKMLRQAGIDVREVVALA
jgi:copper chaperone CopZ